jgi:hypothetical protein
MLKYIGQLFISSWKDTIFVQNGVPKMLQIGLYLHLVVPNNNLILLVTQNLIDSFDFTELFYMP